ncbi:MAG: HNH endonuclease [Burkholderiales bacterium]|nr:HNH endonuclease [Burkholderiales bacterium]
MPSNDTCQFEGQRISVREAKRIRANVPQPEWRAFPFLCIHCGGHVKPHLGEGNTPHFEHWPGENHDCPVRHIPKGQASAATSPVVRDFDDPATIEGAKSDVTKMVSARDKAAAAACKKRDQYVCQACGFCLKVGNRYVVDCHHLFPLALGVRETLLDDLVSLCPTCHRIAHTRNVPLMIADIRHLMAPKAPA